MKPKATSDSKHPAIIIEFKVFDKDRGEKVLLDIADAVLKQIEEKKYADSLVSEGIKEKNIIKYGFAFKGKEVLIKKYS
ncbi:MAG: PD-(D/E)XK nuclease domain-containing protein [Eubacterium sp.]|nr:PD-(D/E)XK nuclease domain-containing protein [Eubacterium sp.]